MGRNKLEDKWKESRDQKELIPSADTWNRLSSQLDAHDKATRKADYKIFLYLAACIVVGGYLVAQLVWKEQDLIVPNDIESIPAQTIVDIDVDNTVKEEVSQPSNTQSIPKIKSKKTVVFAEHHKKKEPTENLSFSKNTLVEEVEANRSELALNDKDLLKQVEQGLASNQKPDSEQKIIVNSNDLLKQVETEIVVEYREAVVKQLFEKTKKVVVEISNNRYEK